MMIGATDRDRQQIGNLRGSVQKRRN